MKIVKDGWPLIIGPLVVAGVAGGLLAVSGHPAAAVWVASVFGVVGAFMVYFFRDPERAVPADPNVMVAGADGLVRQVEIIQEQRFLNVETVRISTFLSPFNVHVNRTPMGGTVRHLSYTPGRHLLTIQNASSERNEHSSILVEGKDTRCLVKQIVGPIVRRVVYWLDMGQSLEKGDRIGMMKFGSRLDMYFPAADVRVVVKKGDRVRAGETVVAVLKKGGAS